jgi:hypothetical protein
MLFQGGFSFANFLTDVIAVFLFVVWFWLLVVVYADLFRRHDISGWEGALGDSRPVVFLHWHIRIPDLARKGLS